MKISVIIPVFNEEKSISRLLENLNQIKEQCEIIFVDGGSTDQTIAMISSEFIVLHSEKGRAHQMNLGAVMSTGEALFFLHSDSEVPPTALEEIEGVLKEYKVGFFGIEFHFPNIWMKCCSHMSNARARFRGIMFGDQGIFIKRELFFEVGMFPTLPIMEDYQFSLNLKKRKVKSGMAQNRIYTSERRFSGNSLKKLLVMWQMNRLRAMYRRGVPIKEISSRYVDIR